MTSEEKQAAMNDIEVIERGMVRFQTVDISAREYSAKSLLDLAATMIFEGFSVTLDREGLHAERQLRVADDAAGNQHAQDDTRGKGEVRR